MNQSFDINHLPQQRGMLIFGISMSKISNAQSPEKCFEYMTYLANKLKKTQGVGLTIIYSDYLYMLTDPGTSVEKRQKYQELMTAHKQGFMNLMMKGAEWIPSSVGFFTWGQVLINLPTIKTFTNKLMKEAKTNEELQEALRIDAEDRELTAEQQQFFIEESIMFHLLVKGEYSFPNGYVQHREEWILNCYPGPALAVEKFINKHNYFKLDNPKNKYQHHHYNLEEKVLDDLRI